MSARNGRVLNYQQGAVLVPLSTTRGFRGQREREYPSRKTLGFLRRNVDEPKYDLL